MIKINNITRGRFGNRILQYNAAYQLSSRLSTHLSCAEWEGNEVFDSLPSRQISPRRPEKLLTWREVLCCDWSEIEQLHQQYDLSVDDPAYLLHNVYFSLTHVYPRKFLKIDKKFLPVFDENTINVGIHIRGDDIRGADGNNGREIHSFAYYKKALDEILRQTKIDSINITTDDVGFDLFKNVTAYANSLPVPVSLGRATLDPSLPHFYDFALLAQCDYLIASSSTYAICAGFLGKNKKIIHSLEWVMRNTPGPSYWKWGNYTSAYPQEYWTSYDNFWLSAYRGDNQFYKPWKIL